MKVEETIKNLLTELIEMIDNGSQRDLDRADEISNIILKALKQEPCGDCISREAVINRINRLIEVEKKQGTDDWGYGQERVNAYEAMLYMVESEYLYPSVEPEKCNDCISRKDIYFKLTNGAYAEESAEQFIDRITKEIENMPPVTPQPKTGHWIETGSGQECSECRKVQHGYDNFRHFCANCGAKMESEE